MTLPEQMDWVMRRIEKITCAPMYIEIDDKSGFCFGVVKAITKAEESLAELGKGLFRWEISYTIASKSSGSKARA